MLQRLLSSSSSSSGSGKHKKDKDIEPCEEVEDGQPHNSYSEILILQHHSDIVRILLPVSDTRFVSAGDDNKAVIWEIKYGRRIATLIGHSHPITSLLLLPPLEVNKDPLIVSGSSDKQIRMWDAETGQCQLVLTEHGASVRCLLLLDEGLFCAGGENLCLWNRNGELLNFVDNHADDDIHLMISIKQDRIVTAADKELVAYKLQRMPDYSKFELIKVKQLPRFHRDAIRSLVPISSSCFASGSVDGLIIIWTSSNFQPARRLNEIEDYLGHTNRFPYSVQAMMCVQERYLFAAVGCGFCAYEVTTEKDNLIIQKKSAHLSKVTCMGFACEGDFLVTCSEDKCLRLWGCKPNADSSVGDDMAKDDKTPMKKFTGLQCQELHQAFTKVPWEPSLLGECSAHDGSVQGFLDFGLEGMVSCGADGLVIIWKNAELQKVRRNQTMQKLLMGSEVTE